MSRKSAPAQFSRVSKSCDLPSAIRRDPKVARASSIDAALLSVCDADRRSGLPEAGAEKQKFLCGHDERAWFVAAVPADDRGLQYGDGVFETVLLRAGRARHQSERRRKRG